MVDHGATWVDEVSAQGEEVNRKAFTAVANNRNKTTPSVSSAFGPALGCIVVGALSVANPGSTRRWKFVPNLEVMAGSANHGGGTPV